MVEGFDGLIELVGPVSQELVLSIHVIVFSKFGGAESLHDMQ
jgi:hypothetical protein